MNQLANTEHAFQLTIQHDESSDSGDATPDASYLQKMDSELFLRNAFDADPEKGYQLLFKRYYHPLCSHAVRFVYSREVAEDLVVDVFTQFWQKRLHLSVTTSFRAYLFTSVRHAAFAHLRIEFGRHMVGEEWLENESNTPQNPQQLLQYNELYLKIEDIIRSVPSQSQKVFIMSRFEGKKNATIADELQLSVKTVEGHITKVLSILRQSLRDSGLLSLVLFSFFWGAEQGIEFLFSLLRIATTIKL